MDCLPVLFHFLHFNIPLFPNSQLASPHQFEHTFTSSGPRKTLNLTHTQCQSKTDEGTGAWGWGWGRQRILPLLAQGRLLYTLTHKYLQRMQNYLGCDQTIRGQERSHTIINSNTIQPCLGLQGFYRPCKKQK